METIKSIIICLVCFNVISVAQTDSPLRIYIQRDSKVWLEGNSTMHEYSAAASEVLGTILADSALFSGEGKNPVRLFRRVEMTIPVRKMHSGNEKLDDKMFDALQADDHPDVTYRLTGDTILAGTMKDSLEVQASGTLTVAGKEKPIELRVILT